MRWGCDKGIGASSGRDPGGRASPLRVFFVVGIDRAGSPGSLGGFAFRRRRLSKGHPRYGKGASLAGTPRTIATLVYRSVAAHSRGSLHGIAVQETRRSGDYPSVTALGLFHLSNQLRR